MKEQEIREKRILSRLNLDKLPYKIENNTFKTLGAEVSTFIHYVFSMRQKSESLNWCFANIKRVKIFLQIFHANESGKEIYKEEIAKNIYEFCRLEWDKKALEFYKRKDLFTSTASNLQIRNGLHNYDKNKYRPYYYLLKNFQDKYEWLNQ